jgi:AraC-like DNA-binding protein
MNGQQARIEIEAWETKGALLEKYSYAPGKVEPLPSHVHAEYQFALSFTSIGEYSYRGCKLKIPAGNLCVLHSGEPHAPSDAREVAKPSVYWMLYVEPGEISNIAVEISGKPFAGLPYFSNVLLADRDLVADFLRLFERNATAAHASRLELDEARLDFFSKLILRYAQNLPPAPPVKTDAPGVRRTVEFLQENFRENVSLADLTEVSGVSKFHLCRAFRRLTGVSPHAYQTHLRLSHAKKLLLRGKSIADVAARLGFYDQSHFGQKFKNFVGVSPKTYQL